MLTDPYGRPVDSIRISLTQRCNLRCFYCHLEGEIPKKTIEMTPEEIQRIVNLAVSFSIRKVKLTGGEPLMRSDILEIVNMIRDSRGVEEVSMTTNGIFLAGLAEGLKKAGLTRINVSLDTLNHERFKRITGSTGLEAVISGIREAVKTGLCPLKVNMVLLKGVNEDEVSKMIGFTKDHGLILQIIELESPDEDELYKRYHVDLDDVESYIKNNARTVTVRRMHHRRKYGLRNGGEIEIVRPMHNTEFCQYCNRIRVTSDGKLKPCLFRNSNLVDILGPMREGASEETLRNLFLEAVRRRQPYFREFPQKTQPLKLS